ncbi:hypothetical protein LIZ87_03365 [Lacrimispora sp. 210928-DFI.3.58]|nr:hypothetical protein [Lacrimispora sp. 210928-DFI.3.58]
MAGTVDGRGKGTTPKGGYFLAVVPSGCMVKNHVTVILVDGELLKNVYSS